MYAYIYLHSIHRYAVAMLVIQLIAYLALACLYIYNSCRQDKFISAGYLELVMSVFLLSFRNQQAHSGTYLIEPISWANMVAISSYCVWKCSFILHYCWLKKHVRTILHGAIVAILLVLIISAFGLYRSNHHGHRYYGYYYSQREEYNSIKVWLLIQLVAYNAVAFLYICNSSGPKEKVISAGLLVLVLFAFLLLCSFLKRDLRTDLIFGPTL
jgi:hypothetical protein